MTDDLAPYQQLWNDLSERADRQPDPTLPAKATARQIPLADRVAGHYLKGALALLLMMVPATLLAGLWGGPLVMTASLLCVPLIAWYLAPFSRSLGMVSAPRLLLLGLPALLMATLTTVGPSALGQVANRGPLHPEIFAVAWQRSLEAVLQVGPTVVCLVSLAGVALLAAWLRQRFPWLDGVKPSRTAVLLRLFLALGFLLPLGWAVSASQPNSREADWLQDMRELSLTRPHAALPRENSDHHWRELLEVQQQRIGEVRQRLGDKSDFVALALGELNPDTDLRAHRPSSLNEVSAANNYLLQLRGPKASVEAFLAYYELCLLDRPSPTTTFAQELPEELFPALLDPSVATERLRSWLAKVRQLRSLSMDPMRALDLEFYHDLHDESLYQQGSPGWSSSETWSESRQEGRRSFFDWVYVGNPRPRPLRFFGAELPWSPTLTLERIQNRALVGQWLSQRDRLAKLSPDQRRKRFQALADGQLENTRENLLWRAMSRRTDEAKEPALLAAAEVILAARLQARIQGRYPAELAELKLDIPGQDLPGWTVEQTVAWVILAAPLEGRFPLPREPR